MQVPLTGKKFYGKRVIAPQKCSLLTRIHSQSVFLDRVFLQQNTITHSLNVVIFLQKWGDCDAFGEPVFPTRFVPMKTPLGSEIIENWNHDQPPSHPLTLDMLVEAQTVAGRRVGMIIDLSNHQTLYAADLAEFNIAYERVPVSSFPYHDAHASLSRSLSPSHFLRH